MAERRERYTAAWRTLLAQLLRVGAIHVRRVRIKALQIGLHNPKLVLEHVVLLVRIASIISLALQTLHPILVVHCGVL